MTTAAQPTDIDRADVRTIVTAGAKLGLITTVGVVVFALISRAMSGMAEVVVQSIIIIDAGVLFAYLPSVWIRPRSADGIAWATMVGLLGALVFTVLDVAVLRPASIYHWTWDAIGGGSGFWYIPVWWMGSAFLAWLGGIVVAYASQGGRDPNPLFVGAQTAVLGLVLFVVLAAATAAPFHASIAALAFAIALALHVPLSAAMYRR